MLILVTSPLLETLPGRTRVAIPCTRQQLAKRRWRGVAADGCEFGFELETPLRHDQVVWQSDSATYVIEQNEEELLEVDLSLAPSAAAGVGWAVGNLHLELMSEPHRLLTPDDPAARQLFQRIGIECRPVRGRFRPGRFARGQASSPSHELGTSHRH